MGVLAIGTTPGKTSLGYEQVWNDDEVYDDSIGGVEEDSAPVYRFEPLQYSVPAPSRGDKSPVQQSTRKVAHAPIL